MKIRTLFAASLALTALLTATTAAAAAAPSQTRARSDVQQAASTSAAAAYDIARLGDAATPADALPEAVNPAELVEGYVASSSRLLATSGTATFWVTVSEKGQLCFVAVTGLDTKDWYSASSCTSADSFTKVGTGLRMISPTNAIEAYLTPDSAASIVGRVESAEAVSANVTVVDPFLPGAHRVEQARDGFTQHLLGELDLTGGS